MKLNFKLLILLPLIFLIIYWYNYDESGRGYAVTLKSPSSIKRKHHEGLLDLPDFSYLLIPRNACQTNNVSQTPIKYLQIITSYAGEVIARSAIRRAYPIDELQELGIWRIFLLAQTMPGSRTDITQSAIENENKRFGDILQGNFFESYRNLTYKHTMGLKWASEACSYIQYIIKMDDDIVTDLYSILNIIETSHGSFDFLGYVFEKLRPIRIKANKWYVTKEEFDGNNYPKFVSGWLYVTNPKTAYNVVATAKTLPYFWIDDVFLTGVVAEKINSRFVDVSQLFTTFPESLDCCISHNETCSYSVGPNGGDYELQVRFQKFAKICRSNCSRVHQNGSHVCVAKRVQPQLRKGLPSVRIIKIR